MPGKPPPHDTSDNYPLTSENLIKITLTSPKFGSFVVFPANFKNLPIASVYQLFHSLSIKESLFSPIVSGKLFLLDVHDFTDNLNLNSFDEITLVFKKNVKAAPITYKAIITGIVPVTDDAVITDKMNASEYIRIIALEFMNKDLFKAQYQTQQSLPDKYDNNNNKLYVDKDFIGYISSKSTTPIPGLIQKVFNKNKFKYKEINVEDTSNGIWLKYNNINNPNKDQLSQFKLIDLLKIITENAVDKSKNNVNYCLWSDITHNWHFKSLSTIIKEGKNRPPYDIWVNPDIPCGDKIMSSTVIEFNDTISNLESNILFSSYKRIDPDYTNKYIDFTDSNIGVTTGIVTYDYFDLFNKVEHLYDNPIITKSEFDIKTIQKDLKKVSTDKKLLYQDPITNMNISDYGYFNPVPYNINYTEQVWWDYLGKSNSTYSNISWQTQYDITNLSLPLFYNIHKKIRVPLMQKRLEFARLKNIKRKWETFRCVVCCLDQPIGSTQDLIDFEEAAAHPTGYTFGVLYGSTLGFFQNTQKQPKDYIHFGEGNKYQIIAAGSFTDLINYGITFSSQNGLTYSRDLSKAPYKETIEEFYNIAGETTNIYSKYITEIIDKGTLKYTEKKNNNIERLHVIKTFLDSIDGYINNSIRFIHNNLVPCAKCNESGNSLRTIIDTNNYWSVLRQSSNINLAGITNQSIDCQDPCGITAAADLPNPKVFFENTSDAKARGHTNTVNCGYNPFYGGPFIPVFQKNISGSSADNRGNTYTPHMTVEGIGTVPYFEIPQYTCIKTINFAYDWTALENELEDTGFGNKIFSGYNDIYKELFNPGNPGYSGLTYALEPEFFGSLYGPEFQQLPGWVLSLSANKFMKGSNQYNTSMLLEPGSGGTYYNKQSQWEGKPICIGKGPCYNEHCFNPNLLIALKEIAARQFNNLKVENYLLDKIRTIIENGLKDKWKDQYTEWLNRKVFFYSQLPGKNIFKGDINKGFRGASLYQPLSLEGIKTITRKDIRGSRYEILSKARGITGASMGNWLYNIFFDEGYGGNTASFKGTTANPYYEQTYSQTGITFLSNTSTIIKSISKNTIIKYYSNSKNSMDINTNYTFMSYLNAIEVYGISGDGIVNVNSKIYSSDGNNPQLNGATASFDFNVYNKISNKIKPANIKREEIASYVRVEFEFPVGLNRISDFPDGFIRSAGIEYFLPYLVSLTSGPVGRQSVRNNIAIIGMDPYGFDIAVKKMKMNGENDKTQNTEILKTDVSSNGMDLWPEPIFETKYQYYATDSRGIFPYTDPNIQSHKNKLSAEIDPERKNTAMGSGILMNSHRKMKIHRSWWSFHMPHNIFIPQQLYSILTTDLSNIFKHGGQDIKTILPQTFDEWLSFTPDETIKDLLKNTDWTI